MASGAPFLKRRPSTVSRPLRRVCAVKGMTSPEVSLGAVPPSVSEPSLTIDLPSGVRSPNDAYIAAAARLSRVTFGIAK